MGKVEERGGVRIKEMERWEIKKKAGMDFNRLTLDQKIVYEIDISNIIRIQKRIRY